MRRPLSSLALAAMLLLATACVPPRAPTSSSGVVVVPASIDATGSRDVAHALTSFIASVPNGKVVRFAKNARYRAEERVTIAGRRDLTIEGNGATILATTPGHANRSHLRIEDSQRIVVRDLTVRGAHPAAGTSPEAYQPAREHQHGIDARSVRGLTLRNVRITDTFGDFVYLGMLKDRPWTSDVVIRDSHFARNGRQGIALIAVRDVLIERSSIRDVRRATFDFEPRAAGAGVERVTIRDNEIGAGRLMFVAAGGSGPVHDVSVVRNRLRGQAMQFLVHHGLPGHRDRWRVVDNTSDLRHGSPHASTMRFWRLNGLEVRGNHQVFQTGRDMVLAHVRNSCAVDIRGNTGPGSVGEHRVEGTC